MIVLDASVVVDVLLRRPGSEALMQRLWRSIEPWHAPDILDLEVIQVIGRFRRARELDDRRANECFDDLIALPLERHGVTSLLPRVWSLRHAMSAYDAAYVALAEALDTKLLTRDAGVVKAAPGRRAQLI